MFTATAGAGSEEPGDGPTAEATESGTQHQPTAIELTCDQSDLQAIRDKFGSRAQTIINMALAFDAYLRCYYPYKTAVPFMCDMRRREERALDNMRSAIDMMEIFERVSIQRHGSFLIHGAVYKCTRDILTLGNPWAVNLSPLELQNAETKRTATAGGSKHLELGATTMVRAPQMKLAEGPAMLVERKGYGTTMSISTLQNLSACQYLRRGDGIVAFEDSRRKERLFGMLGRTKPMPVGDNEAKRNAEYNPLTDTCIKAFVRLLAEMPAATDP